MLRTRLKILHNSRNIPPLIALEKMLVMPRHSVVCVRLSKCVLTELLSPLTQLLCEVLGGLVKINSATGVPSGRICLCRTAVKTT